eukprot:gb/GECG01014175.1/.p1 GENE.gb/GECG01014175.1/~~gb/GECG01014175.1/.p1  ORF type:complete len:110 (+),score=6.61 gb/GECG01014175.1/:1-330(+)
MEFEEGDNEFVIEDVEMIIRNALQQTLADSAYQANKVDTWTNQIIDSCLKGLKDLNKPFKYIVTCIIVQKTGSSVHTAASTYWDVKRDGMQNARFVARTPCSSRFALLL